MRVTRRPIDYMSYTCCTQEMREEIDAICEKYVLEILGPVYDTTIRMILVLKGLMADDAEVLEHMDRASVEDFSETFTFAYTPKGRTGNLVQPQWYDN